MPPYRFFDRHHFGLTNPPPCNTVEASTPRTVVCIADLKIARFGKNPFVYYYDNTMGW